MNKDAVQNERGPRNSTLRRQMAMFMNKDSMMSDMSHQLRHDMMFQSNINVMPYRAPIIPSMVLDLSVRRNASMLGHPTYLPPMMFHPAPQTPTPPQTPPFHPIEIQDSAAKIVLSNVAWVKHHSAVSQLNMSDQLHILEESWKELFLIGIAKEYHYNFSRFLCAYETQTSLNNNTPIRSARDKIASSLHRDVKNIQHILNKFASLNINAYEFECLREIAAFKSEFESDINQSTSSGGSPSSTPDHKQMYHARLIQTLQEDARERLRAHARLLTGDPALQQSRCDQLMRLLPQIKEVCTTSIEELFFANTIENFSIVNTLKTSYLSREKIPGL